MSARLRPNVLLVQVLLLLLAVPLSMAEQQRDEVGFGRTITVPAGETRGEISCFHCTVYVRGTVNGDVAVIGGRLVIDGTVSQDVAVLWGDVRIGDSGRVGGDLAALGGTIKKSPSATVRGDTASFGREAFVAGCLLGLAIFFGGIALFIWLIVWLVRRRRPAPGTPAVQQPSR